MRLIDLKYYFNDEEYCKYIVFGVDKDDPFYWVGYNLFGGKVCNYWSDNDVSIGIRYSDEFIKYYI